MTVSPIFEFDLRIVQYDRSGYYHPCWDKAEKVTVRAATMDEAFEKAFTMMGEPPRGRGWVWRAVCDQIREVAA